MKAIEDFLRTRQEEDLAIGKAIRESRYNIEIEFFESDGYVVILRETKYGCWIKQGRGLSVYQAFIDVGLIKEVIIDQK